MFLLLLRQNEIKIFYLIYYVRRDGGQYARWRTDRLFCPLLCAFCLLILVNSTSKESRQRRFLPSDEITAAKERLVKDAQALSLDGMPTIARRRNSDNRYQRECDDMVDIITFLDERKVLSRLPHYAFDCSDHFPSAHLDEGDMRLLLRKLDNMQEELIITRKLVQQAQQGKPRFDQMLHKVLRH